MSITFSLSSIISYFKASSSLSIVYTLVVASLSTLLIFYFNIDSVAGFFINVSEEMVLYRQGIKKHSIQIDDKTVAHYCSISIKNTDSNVELHDLIMIGGFTTEIEQFGEVVATFLRTRKRLNPNERWRVVVMELPFHGQNQKFSLSQENLPTSDDMMDFTVKFIDAMGMGRNIPLSVWGYSLGAGTAVSLLAHYPERVWKLVAVAPAFYETLDDQFAKQIRKDPRKVHAWETVPDCQHFFYDCLGFHKEDFAVVPQWILWRGLVSQRLATYPTGYFSRFAKQLVESRKEQTKLSDIAPFMKSAKTPVLLVLGERDACVNVNKCAQIERQFGNEYCTKVVVKDHGHLGGPKRIGNFFMTRNLWTESAKLSAQFL